MSAEGPLVEQALAGRTGADVAALLVELARVTADGRHDDTFDQVEAALGGPQAASLLMQLWSATPDPTVSALCDALAVDETSRMGQLSVELVAAPIRRALHDGGQRAWRALLAHLWDTETGPVVAVAAGLADGWEGTLDGLRRAAHAVLAADTERSP